jgi:hypothetical protein
MLPVLNPILTSEIPVFVITTLTPIDHEFFIAVGLIAPQPQPNTCQNVAPRHCYSRSLRDLALRVITQIALPPIPTQISQAVCGQPTKHGSVKSKDRAFGFVQGRVKCAGGSFFSLLAAPVGFPSLQ